MRMVKPSPLRRATASAIFSSSAYALSVISSSSRRWSRSYLETRPSSASTTSMAYRSAREMVTDTGMGTPPRSIHERIWRHASSHTYRSRLAMKLLRSSTGMNAPGLTMPREGCCQRTRASRPTMRSVRVLHCGCQCSTNSWFVSARFTSSRIFASVSISSVISASYQAMRLV